MKDSKGIAERITQIRLDNGLSINALAKRCGVNSANLSRSLTGQASFSDKVLYKISNGMSVNLDWVLTGEGEMFKNASTINHNVVHGDANNSIVGDNNNVGYAPNKYGDSPEIDRNWAPVIPPSVAHMPEFDILGHVTKQLTGGSVERLYSGTANIDVWHYIDDDALLPYYRRGDCLGLKAYPKGDLRIIPGEVYAVDTHRDGLIVRILRWDEVGEILACCTNREEYQDFQIPKSDIIRIYKKVLRFSY